MARADGYVVAERDVAAAGVAGETASTKVTIDDRVGCERLVQRVDRYRPGRSGPRAVGERQEVLYVASGVATIHVAGESHQVGRDAGVFVAPGEEYEVEVPGHDDLVVVAVSAPAESTTRASRRVVRYEEQPALPATPNREFRFLVDRDAGCLDVTQFVGVIPPGRAPMHSHTYDEVVYVVEGEGVLHLSGKETPIAGGTCIHLPPLVMHCLENTGETPMRILGVFHPSGDPASRAAVANQ